MPKLLLVGIVERTCNKTVVREIPGIKDCFQVKEDQKDGIQKVSLSALSLNSATHFLTAHNEWIELARAVGFCSRQWGEYSRG